MQTYNIYRGEYPFDELLGQTQAETAEQALQQAIKQLNGVDLHPVVEPADSNLSIN